MKQWTFKEFSKMLIKNGYHIDRSSGGHVIFRNSSGQHISVPYRKLECVIARRLIRENKLNTDL